VRFDVNGSTATDLSSATSVPGLHVVANENLERLLFDRNALGGEFRTRVLNASRLMVRHVADELEGGEFTELILLSKGLVYQLAQAAMMEGITDLPCNLMATSRVSVTGHTARVEVSYSRLDAGGSRLVIGDTVASGSTLIAALSRYLERYDLHDVIIFSFAGTQLGAARIVKFCQDHGIRCLLLFGLAVFGLGDNGFDLSFLHPETITHPDYVERARAQFSGKPVSAIGWDFGSQAMAPQKYRELCWLEAEMWNLHGHPSLAREQRPNSLENIRQEYAAFSNKVEGA
jgi:hypothetical protein